MASIISIGQLIDKSWDHYVAHFKQLMAISMFALIIPVLMLIRMLLSPSGEAQTLAAMLEGQYDALSITGIIIGFLVSFIVIPIITIWIYIMLVKVIGAQDKGTAYTLKQLRSDGWKSFLPYLFVGFLKTVISIAPMLAIIPGLALIFFNIYSDGGAIWGGIGMFLTFVSVIVACLLVTMLSVQLAFVGYENILMQKKGIKAILGSRSIVNNRFWATLWRLFVTKLIFSIVTGLIMALAVVISYTLTYAIYQIVQNTTALVLSSSFEMLLSSGVAILTTPIFIIADYYIYDNLNKTR